VSYNFKAQLLDPHCPFKFQSTTGYG